MRNLETTLTELRFPDLGNNPHRTCKYNEIGLEPPIRFISMPIFAEF